MTIIGCRGRGKHVNNLWSNARVPSESPKVWIARDDRPDETIYRKVYSSKVKYLVYPLR